MDAFETDALAPVRARARRLSARDALICVGVAVVLLVLFGGSSIRSAGEEMDPGFTRTLVLAVGHPTGWVADRLPFADVAGELTSALSPDEDLGGDSGTAARNRPGGVPPVGEEAFDPRALGAAERKPRSLRTLLVTGDSMAMPLDVELARRLEGDEGVRTVRDPHIGTGISKTDLVDWRRLSAKQTRERSPEAVVVFIGANEGFPMPGPSGRELSCCGPAWAAEYAYRARQVMNAYRQAGAARVYWLMLPIPRDGERARIARAVNAALQVAAQPYRAHVRVLDLAKTFTPGGRFRATMSVNGRETTVRESDGIHLNAAGAKLAADIVLARVRDDFDAR